MSNITKLSVFFFLCSIINSLAQSESENFVTSSDVQFELILDNVMGGISTAELDTTEDDEGNSVLNFDGQLSLENNGGFAMFRGTIGELCKGYDQIHFNARTDNPERTYKTLVSTGPNSGFYDYSIALEEEYKSFIIDLKDMSYQFMGWGMSWMKGPSGDKVRQVGMTIYDKNTDPFQVDIKEIQCV